MKEHIKNKKKNLKEKNLKKRLLTLKVKVKSYHVMMTYILRMFAS